MGTLKKGDKRWTDMQYMGKKALKWDKEGRVPANLPKDFVLQDADGKPLAYLNRGKPVEWVKKPAGAPSASADIDAAAAGIPHVAWTPPPVEFTPPSKTGAVAVGPQVPIADVVDPEVFAMYGEVVNSCVEEQYKARYSMDVSDARCAKLSLLTARAWPGVAVSPKVAWVIAIVLWHGKIIIYIVRYKLKGAVAWLKAKFGKKKDADKPPEAKA